MRRGCGRWRSRDRRTPAGSRRAGRRMQGPSGPRVAWELSSAFQDGACFVSPATPEARIEVD